MAFLLERLVEFACLAECQRSGNFRNTFVGIQEHVFCFADLQGNIISMRCAVGKLLKHIVETGWAVADVIGNTCN